MKEEEKIGGGDEEVRLLVMTRERAATRRPQTGDVFLGDRFFFPVPIEDEDVKVDTGEEGYGTVEKVARMLDVAALELHFSVGEP